MVMTAVRCAVRSSHTLTHTVETGDFLGEYPKPLGCFCSRFPTSASSPVGALMLLWLLLNHFVDHVVVSDSNFHVCVGPDTLRVAPVR